jgi:5-methyltetrahydropteroyltriglutamate--homocysteine methyltransferase
MALERTPRRPARAETVGSLLRPHALKDGMAAFYTAGHSAVLQEERAKDRSELQALEDEAIRDAIGRQIGCGLDVVTDGEFRRWMYLNSFYDAVGGVRTGKVISSFRNDRGEGVELNVHEIVGRLRPLDSPAAREAAFLSGETDGYPFKVTFPAASLFTHPLTTVSGPDGSGYEDVDAFVDHAIEIERALVADAIAAGARYIQFDFPLYPYLVDPAWIGRFTSAGRDAATLVDEAIAADTAVLEGIPDGVTTALHICRGNYQSSWLCEGSLEPVAERVFDLPYDAFLVEWDDVGRDGGFEPIRFLRDDALMVMGIVSSKFRELEDEDDLVRRMDEAAAIVGGMDRLAISSQCGFASVMVGNDIDEDTQWHKLELVGRVAARIWG